MSVSEVQMLSEGGASFEPLRLVARTEAHLIYEAVRPEYADRVALKVTQTSDRHWVNRLLREGDALQLVAHPAIVRIVDSGRLVDGRAYLALEWVVGETLRVSQRRQPLMPAEYVVLMHALSDAMAMMHDRGILHRDMKPENVLIPMALGDRILSKPRICDFSEHARRARLTEQNVSPIAFGRWSGTAWYMAPEQLLGRSQSEQTDLYALGIILYELAYGKVPMADLPIHRVKRGAGLPAPHVGNFVIRRCTEQIAVEERADVPTDVSQILRQLLRLDPHERPASASQLSAMLARLELGVD